jgi:hypothetical protein
VDVPVLCKWVVSALLIVAALGKLINLSYFAKKVQSYAKSTASAAKFIAAFIVLSELSIGVWMLTPGPNPLSVYAAISLLGFFTIVSTVNLVARKSTECGCIPFLPSLRVTWVLIVRNLNFCMLAWLSTSPSVVHSTRTIVFILVLFTITCTFVADLSPKVWRGATLGDAASLRS